MRRIRQNIQRRLIDPALQSVIPQGGRLWREHWWRLPVPTIAELDAAQDTLVVVQACIVRYTPANYIASVLVEPQQNGRGQLPELPLDTSQPDCCRASPQTESRARRLKQEGLHGRGRVLAEALRENCS
jgi:hypothetical protein